MNKRVGFLYRIYRLEFGIMLSYNVEYIYIVKFYK